MPVITSQFHRSQICHWQRFQATEERRQMGRNKKSAKYDSSGKYLTVKKVLIFLEIGADFEVQWQCPRQEINLGGR